jgi:hypothetical protein
MMNEQLTGKHARLCSELAAARAEPPWSRGRTGRIDRIANELIEIERALAQRPAAADGALDNSVACVG